MTPIEELKLIILYVFCFIFLIQTLPLFIGGYYIFSLLSWLIGMIIAVYIEKDDYFKGTTTASPVHNSRKTT